MSGRMDHMTEQGEDVIILWDNWNEEELRKEFKQGGSIGVINKGWE